MKTRTSGIPALLHAPILLILAVILAGCGLSRTAKESAGVAAPETILGFPSYSTSIIGSVMHAVDGAILEQERIIRALTALPRVRKGKWDGMRETVAAFQRSCGDAGVYWFALPDGRYYTAEKGLVDATLQDRPYFPKVMAGREVVGELVVSKSTGQKSTIITIPVLNEKGKVTGALGISLFLEPLTESLMRGIPLPEGSLFYVLAGDGTTAMHMNLGLVFDNPLKKDSPTLKHAAEKMLSTEAGEVEYEFAGFRKRVRYATSPLTGWRFAFGLNTRKL